jgi:hypothetical protein
MKTNYHLRLPAMGAAALLAAALLCASASAAVTFHEYMTVTGSDAAKGVHADTGYTPGGGTIVRAKNSEFRIWSMVDG